VIDITPQGFKLIELAPGVTKEEVVSKTACTIDVSAV
jgi:3-oxoacid CoA-transferase subunit B